MPQADPGAERRAVLCFGAVALVTVAAYARSCAAPFHFDDHAVISAYEDGYLSTLGGFIAFANTRLIPFATLALNYGIGGLEPAGFHAVNLVLHLLATLLVLQLALVASRAPRLRDTWLAEQRVPFAVAAAAVFALHPVQTQAVTYVVQRASLLGTVFFVAAVICYLRARMAADAARARAAALAYVAAALCALAAFLSKENTASLPLAIVLAEWAFFGVRGLARRITRVLPFALLALVIPLLAALLAPALLRGPAMPLAERLAWIVRLLFYRANPAGGVTPLDYVLTQCVVIPRYLLTLVAPVGLNVDHDVPIVHTLTAAVQVGIGVVTVLVAFAIDAMPRWPAVGFGIGWFFVALSVESSILPISDPMVEHRLYLAMPGVALVAGHGFASLWRRRRPVAASVAVSGVALLAGLTLLRNETWLSPVALWADAASKSPGKARVHVNLGLTLQQGGRTDEAIVHYCRALEIDPDNRQARANLDLLAEEVAEQALEAGEAVMLESGERAAGGVVFGLSPPDPCLARRGKEKEGR